MKRKVSKCYTKASFDNANTLVGTSNANYNPSGLDTTGMLNEQNDWVLVHNDITVKTLSGALNRIMQSPPKGGVQEYGHSFYAPSGSYPQMHGIHGYRNYVVKLANGTFIQLFPEISHSTTQQVVGISNLNESNNRNIVWDKTLYEDQLWMYFKHAGDVVYPPNFAPKWNTWDLMFTAYFDENTGAVEVGALANTDVGLQQLDGVDYYNANFGIVYDETIADIIGHDWKTEPTPGQFQMVPQRNYLVNTVYGNEYLLYFCDFGGAVNGDIEFRVIPRAQIEGIVEPAAQFSSNTQNSCVGATILFTNESSDEDLIEWLYPRISTQNWIQCRQCYSSICTVRDVRCRNCGLYHGWHRHFVLWTLLICNQYINIQELTIANFNVQVNAQMVNVQDLSTDADSILFDSW